MFEKIIGYENEKQELMKFCDVIINTEYYKSLGINIPKGVLLYGDPGLGKTTFAYSIIEACNRPYFVLRKNADTEKFIINMRETFEQAKNTAPSIILLDDMDKFGNGEAFSPEYTSLQGALDDYKPYDIFVIATVNDFFKMPPSLTRSGRFDQVIHIDKPAKEESSLISNYYIDTKNINIDQNVNREVIGRLLNGCSCATIEVVVNTAAMYAAYERSNTIQMNHFVDAILNIVYNMPKTYDSRPINVKYAKAIHEAGKAVAELLIKPDYLTFVTIRNMTFTPGKDIKNVIFEDTKFEDNRNKLFEDFLKDIIILYSGKTAYEMKFNSYDVYAYSDLGNADVTIDLIMDLNISGTTEDAINRSDSIMIDNGTEGITKERIINNAVDQCKMLLSRNWYTVENIASALLQKDVLTADEIVAIANRNNYRILTY